MENESKAIAIVVNDISECYLATIPDGAFVHLGDLVVIECEFYYVIITDFYTDNEKITVMNLLGQNKKMEISKVYREVL